MHHKYTKLILLLLLFNQTNATTFTTAVSGNWSNVGCWINNSMPQFSFSDTVKIKHHIVLSNDLTLLNGAYLLIESTGGICGHVNIFMNTGTNLLKYGILEIDVLNMNGGIANLLPPGNTILTQYGQLTNGASFNASSNFMVGPWFECQMPEYQFVNGLHDAIKIKQLIVSPNPTEGFLIIELPTNNDKNLITITNSLGVLLLKKQLFSNQIDVSDLKSGIYFIEIINNESYYNTKFCKQ